MPGPGWGSPHRYCRTCRAQDAPGQDGDGAMAMPGTTIRVSRRSWPRKAGQAVLSDLGIMVESPRLNAARSRGGR